MVRAIVQDLREAARDLRRHPKFALTVLLLLSVGIGTNVAVFTVVHALLLQPLPYKNPEQLVRLWETNPQLGISRSAVSRGNFFDWRERAASLGYIEAFHNPSDRLVRFGSSDPEILRQASGTEGFLDMLGVAPVIGRNTEGIRLSHSFWQRRFGGDPDVVGAKYVVEGRTRARTADGALETLQRAARKDHTANGRSLEGMRRFWVIVRRDLPALFERSVAPTCGSANTSSSSTGELPPIAVRIG